MRRRALSRACQEATGGHAETGEIWLDAAGSRGTSWSLREATRGREGARGLVSADVRRLGRVAVSLSGPGSGRPPSREPVWSAPPKRPKTPPGARRPADVIGNAVRVMPIATGEADDPRETRNPAAVARRKLGASNGGVARASALKPSTRRAIARKAAAARWKRSSGQISPFCRHLLRPASLLLSPLQLSDRIADIRERWIFIERGTLKSRPTKLVRILHEPSKALEADHEHQIEGASQFLESADLPSRVIHVFEPRDLRLPHAGQFSQLRLCQIAALSQDFDLRSDVRV